MSQFWLPVDYKSPSCVRDDSTDSDLCIGSAGRQRVSIHLDTIAINDLARCRVAVLPEPGNGPLPWEVRQGAARWPPAALPMYDAAELADQARTLFRHFAPEVGTSLCVRESGMLGRQAAQ